MIPSLFIGIKTTIEEGPKYLHYTTLTIQRERVREGERKRKRERERERERGGDLPKLKKRMRAWPPSQQSTSRGPHTDIFQVWFTGLLQQAQPCTGLVEVLQPYWQQAQSPSNSSKVCAHVGTDV